MKRIYRIGIMIVIVAVCLVLDQAAKNMARQMLASAPPISLLNDFIHIEYAENSGGMLSVGANLPYEARFIFFTVVVGIIIAGTVVFTMLARTLSWPQLTGLSLIVAGGLGNLVDRIMNHGVVVDFLRFGIGPLQTGILNLADVFVAVGLVVFLLVSMREEKKTTAPTDAGNPV